MRLAAAINELAGVQALHSHPPFLLQFVAVRVMEDDLRHGRAAAGVVDDLPDQPLDETRALGVVHGPELDGSLAQPGLRGEDEGLALARPADDASHGSPSSSPRRPGCARE